MHKYLLLILSLVPSYAPADEECDFNPNAFDKTWINNKPALKNFTWNADKREFKIILSAKESIIISGGGCAHYGERFILTITDIKKTSRKEKWYKKRLLKLAALVLNKYGLEEFKKQLSTIKIPISLIKSGKEFYIEPSPTGDYGLIINENPSDIIFEINWYL